MSRRLLIIGAGGHGRVVADAALCAGWREVAFLDDDSSLGESGGLPVLGPASSATDYRGGEFIVAIGNADLRQRQQTTLESWGLPIATIVHPSAVVASSAVIRVGSVVLAGAVVNAGARIGRGCIVNTSASIDHDCVVGDFCHISVGAHLAGTVSLGDRSWIGIGAVVSNDLGVCADCVVGASAAVVRDIVVPGTYVGVPAKLLGAERDR